MSGHIHTFTAAFDSWCAHCFNDIFEGDEIAYVNDEIACTNCVQKARDEAEE